MEKTFRFQQAAFFFASFLLILILSACSSADSAPQEDPVASQVQENQQEAAEPAVNAPEAESQMTGQTEGVPVTWVLNPQASTFAWSAKRLASPPHTGTVQIKEGELTFDGSRFTGGSFVMDMTTIQEDEGSQRVEDHLKSEDFFNVGEYPTSQFKITQVNDLGSGEYEVAGDLTIIGVTHPVTFTAQQAADAGMMSVSANFSIDRTLWGVNFDSNTIKAIGDRAIEDEIPFSLDLVFEQAAISASQQ